jgi:hypothetical protein
MIVLAIKISLNKEELTADRKKLKISMLLVLKQHQAWVL